MRFAQFQQVRLACEIPDKRLRCGDVTTIVECHPGEGGEPGYSVEVFNAVGDTILVTVLPESALDALTADEIFHVRSLSEVGSA